MASMSLSAVRVDGGQADAMHKAVGRHDDHDSMDGDPAVLLSSVETPTTYSHSDTTTLDPTFS